MTRPRIGMGILALIGIAALAMYAINPFHAATLDPRARIIGFLPFRAPSMSMEPTITEGSLFLVNLVTLRHRDPRVGEIVVFRYPPNPDVMYLKRVIGVGGMTIEMRHGVVYLDGKVLEEPYLPAAQITEMVVRGQRIPLPEDHLHYDLPPTRIPENSFFMLGDNRGNSSDSRDWGLVPRDMIVGSYQATLFQPGRRKSP